MRERKREREKRERERKERKREREREKEGERDSSLFRPSALTHSPPLHQIPKLRGDCNKREIAKLSTEWKIEREREKERKKEREYV